MTKKITVAILALFIGLGFFSPVIAGENSLRTTLEKTWEIYLQASNSGKESELEKVMSSFRLGTMKNDLANAKRSLTADMIKSIAQYGPDISTAEFVTLWEKGPTAGLVYVRDSEEKDAAGKPQVTFTFIKFVKEESGWKVDGAMNIGSPKFQDNGKKTKFNPSDLPPTYEIDGKVPKAPAPVNVSEIAAFLDVHCPGYKIQVTVNGIEQPTTIDKSSSGLLKDGLHEGKNSIVIIVTLTEKDTPFKPRVAVRRVLKDKKTAEVFKYEPLKDIEGKHSFTFTVSDSK
ncbi:hypothetical protein JW964_10665 [candidate division KSB1 bacterium]|nr:hypothetical protein [candidate division KSB1 bacterium]